MYCSYCNMKREANEAPCPYCGAPSPTWEIAQAKSWGGGVALADGRAGSFPLPGDSANGQGGQTFTVPYPQGHGMPGQELPQGWGMPGQELSQPEQARQAMMPVPYQGGMLTKPEQRGMPAMPGQFFPAPGRNGMLPALPDEANGAIYVPPMYTKPRAVIPRYRIISGFLSLLIVALLICAGTSYYAKASGNLDRLGKFLGVRLPASVSPTPVPQLPDPPDQVDKGPAFTIIDSATTTAHIDPTTHSPKQTERVFQVNHPFYVTYSVEHPPTKGVVVIKWYTDHAFYRMAESVPIDAGATINGDSEMAFALPTEGTVELYWGDQLAQRLYFVVR